MNVRHSNSLIFIWWLADLEARALKSLTIEPTHLLLGLCKSVDMDLPALFEKSLIEREEALHELLREVGRLRNVFETVCFDARTFRRALRQLSAVDNETAPPESQRLRRSKAAKELFADAERLAELSHGIVFPVHLLYALLSTEEEVRDNLMLRQRLDLERLRKVAKREVLLGWMDDRSVVGRN